MRFKSAVRRSAPKYSSASGTASTEVVAVPNGSPCRLASTRTE
jgi:hypothetical protein